MKLEKREYEDSGDLQALAERVLSVLPDDLEDAALAHWRIFYSSVEPEHIGGKTRRLDGAVRFRTGDDFWILVHRAPFLESDDFEKISLIIHELHHIQREGKGWAVRHHAGDYCEIPEHDVFSHRLALKAMVALGLKYGNDEKVKRLTGLRHA